MGCEPWELRDCFRTDSLGLFIREILIRMFDPDVESMYPFIETETADACADIPSDTRNVVRRYIQRDTENRISALETEIDQLRKELGIYQSFITKANADKMFADFKREGKING